jgi:hypothetical protein
VRITIEIDQSGTASAPAPAAPPSSTSPGSATGTLTAAYDDASAAELARRTGATNAGPAPTGPGAALLGESWDPQTTSAAESGGPAPDVRG